MTLNIDDYRVKPECPINLREIDAEDDGGVRKDDAKDQFRQLIKRLQELQELLYAESKHALLIVFQAMDTGGKDSTIRHVLGPINPQGVRVWNFKVPSPIECAHDYLWRVHHRLPAKGFVSVFNRSHYEDVLIVRVKNLAPEPVWHKRFEHINDFERMVSDEGTRIIKFYLHITSEYQKRRLERRLERPDKQWKFNPDDLAERARWEDYQSAYEDALSRCSTDHAPWFVIPAERRWFRDLLVAQVIVDALESFRMSYPVPSYDPATIVIE